MYTLHGFPSVHSKKVAYVLEVLNLDYRFQFVDLYKGAQRSPEFLKWTPIGKVPVLQIDESFLFESGAICRYLGQVHETKLYPVNPLSRAKVDQWMDFFSSHLGRWIGTIYYENVIKQRANRGPADEKILEEANRFLTRQAKQVNAWLSENQYIGGSEITLADYFAYAYVELCDESGIELTLYPQLQKWLQNLSNQEIINKANERLKA